MVDGGEMKWLGLAAKAVNEGERDEGLVLERERQRKKMLGFAGRKLTKGPGIALFLCVFSQCFSRKSPLCSLLFSLIFSFSSPPFFLAIGHCYI